uniref:Uncharacterized protein n=1 Tax=Anguilla anguilla TaxID=7936 RepID=A0A0E9WH55_ANGAN
MRQNGKNHQIKTPTDMYKNHKTMISTPNLHLQQNQIWNQEQL